MHQFWKNCISQYLLLLCICFGFDNIVCMIFFLLICSVYCCSILAIGNCLFVSLAVLIVANHISHHHFYSATILIQRQVNSKFISNHDSNWKVKQPVWHLHTLCQFSCIFRTLNMDRKLAIFLITIINISDHSSDPITQVPKQCPQCIFPTLRCTINDDMTLMQWKVKQEYYQRWM